MIQLGKFKQKLESELELFNLIIGNHSEKSFGLKHLLIPKFLAFLS